MKAELGPAACGGHPGSHPPPTTSPASLILLSPAQDQPQGARRSPHQPRGTPPSSPTPRPTRAAAPVRAPAPLSAGMLSPTARLGVTWQGQPPAPRARRASHPLSAGWSSLVSQTLRMSQSPTGPVTRATKHHPQPLWVTLGENFHSRTRTCPSRTKGCTPRTPAPESAVDGSSRRGEEAA